MNLSHHFMLMLLESLKSLIHWESMWDKMEMWQTFSENSWKTITSVGSQQWRHWSVLMVSQSKTRQYCKCSLLNSEKLRPLKESSLSTGIHLNCSKKKARDSITFTWVLLITVLSEKLSLSSLNTINQTYSDFMGVLVIKLIFQLFMFLH